MFDRPFRYVGFLTFQAYSPEVEMTLERKLAGALSMNDAAWLQDAIAENRHHRGRLE